jgi:hypothetical protein
VTLLAKVGAGLALSAALALGVQAWRLHRLQQQLHATALRADSLEAANDVSRSVIVSLSAMRERDRARFGDSLRITSRRVVQVRLRADALERDLETARGELVVERRARLEAEVAIRALQATVETVVTADSMDSVRAASFRIRQPPYTADARVALPRPPGLGLLDLAIAVDPAPLELRLDCGTAGPTGVRPARVAVFTPSWLTVELGTVQQDPAVCSPRRQGWRVPWWLVPLVAGGSFVGGLIVH